MRNKITLSFFVVLISVLFFYQLARPNESIKNDIPALPRQGEVHKPQENTISNEPILTLAGKKKSPKEAKKISIKIVIMTVTAYFGVTKDMENYQALRRMNGDGITKSGQRAKIGDVATDTNFYPHGTRFYVPGHGWVVAKDIGGGVSGKHIDVFMGWGKKAYKDALEFGRQKLSVIVVARQ